MWMHWKRRLKALSVSGRELRESVMSNLEQRDFSIGLDSGAKRVMHLLDSGAELSREIETPNRVCHISARMKVLQFGDREVPNLANLESDDTTSKSLFSAGPPM